MTNIVEINKITLNHGHNQIFEEMSLNIEENSFTTIIGSNNSGKTSLAYLLCGILPYTGSIKIFGKSFNKRNTSYINQHLSFVLEDTVNIFSTESVLDELNCNTLDKNEVEYVIKKLKLENLLNRNPNYLSCGEKQLISLACALVRNAKLLILDNSLNMLDNIKRKRVMNLLTQYNKRGLTIINITQNSEDILYGNRVVIFDEGKIVLNDSLKSALEQEKTFVNAHLNLPFMADLCTKLKYYNVISKIELNKVRLVNSIWK